MQESNISVNYYLTNKIKSILIYLVSFILICVESSFYAVNAMSGSIRLLISLGMAAAILLTNVNHKMNVKTMTLGLLLLIMLYAFGVVKTQNEFKQTYVIFAHYFLGLIFAVCIDKEIFIKAFKNIMQFLAIFSLVGFALSYVAMGIVETFPMIPSEKDYNFYNMIFTVVTDNTYVYRNYGLFWEPGAFSIFLCIALYFELLKSKNMNLKRIIILSVALLTTKSTLGIVLLALLFLIYFLQNPFAMNHRQRWLMIFLLTAFILTVLLLPQEFYGDVFNKLFKKTYSGDTNISTQVRYDAIANMLKEFFNSSMLGIGVEKYMYVQEEFCNNMATATIINWFAIYGVLWGLVNTVGYVKFFINDEKRLLIKLLLIGFAVTLITTENFLMNPFVYAIVFYGFGENSDEKIPVNCY